MAITLFRRHLLLTATLGAVLFVTAVATATANASVSPAWQHGAPHLGISHQLHGRGVAASAVGLVLGLVGTALSASFWLLGRRGEVSRWTMWVAGAGAVALAAAYVGAAIVFGS